MTFLSKIIYYLANPLLMPLLNVWVIFQYKSGVFESIHPELKWYIYLLLFLMCTVFPIISIVGLKMTKAISSIHLENKNERSVPFALTLIYYGMAYYILRYKLGLVLPTVIFSGFLACIVSICLVALINIKFKISAHSVGVSGVLGSFLAVGERYFTLDTLETNIYLYALILLCGLTASSRLWLKAHTQAQVYSGLILGFTIVYSFVSFDWFI